MKKPVALSLAILAAACTPTNNQPRPVTSGASPVPTASAIAVPGPTTASSSASPAISSSTPQPSRTATPANPINVSPMPGSTAEIVPDTALRQSLVNEIKAQLPDVTELAPVSALTEEHARQLANNTKDAEFKIKAAYDPVPPGALQTRLIQEGIYPTDNLVNAYLADGSPEAVQTKFREQLKSIIGPVAFSNYGIGVMRKGGGWYLSLILLTQVVHIENLPLTLAGTATPHIRGQILLPGYSQPKILMTRADGNVETVDTKVSGNNFEADVALSQTGLYSFEVNVNGPLGPLPASNFIVAVGRPYPSTQVLDTNSQALGDVSSARLALLELVNRDRQAMGLSVLKGDPNLDLAAQSHSDDMVQNSFIGHNSPTRGTPQQQAADFSVSDLVSQNLAVSRSLSNSERELMSSPGHRRTILEPSHTHVGFGVTTGPDGFLYITQVFVQRKLTVQPIPAKSQVGQTVHVRGTSSAAGHVGIFIDNQLQGDYVTLQAGQSFDLPVTFKSTGKIRLLIGYAEPAGQQLNFTFYNIWDVQVS